MTSHEIKSLRNLCAEVLRGRGQRWLLGHVKVKPLDTEIKDASKAPDRWPNGWDVIWVNRGDRVNEAIVRALVESGLMLERDYASIPDKRGYKLTKQAVAKWFQANGNTNCLRY